MSHAIHIHDGTGIAVTGSDQRPLLVFGATVPTDGVSGYAPGCLFIDTTNGTIYINETTTTADFNRLSSEAAQTLGAVTATSLATTALILSSAAATETIKANTAAALAVTDGTTTFIGVDTRNTVTGVIANTLGGPAMTIAGAAGSTYSKASVTATTITTSTQTTITALDGLALLLGAPTIAQSGGAVTVTTASSLYINKVVAGSSVTITNNYIINTNTSGCFCTAAGVWTDTASTIAVKKDVEDANGDEIYGVLDQIQPRKWKYDPDKMGDDFNRQRYGIVSQELPECFRIPGVTDDQGGLNGSILGSFGLAALKTLRDENRELKARLERLESLLKSN